MLDNNTNKTLWVGIAIGIVAILGIGTTMLFPNALYVTSSHVRNVSLTTANMSQNLLYDAQGNSKYTIAVPKPDASQYDAHINTINVPAGASWYGIYIDVKAQQNWHIGDKYTMKANFKAHDTGLVFPSLGGLYLEIPDTNVTNAKPNGAVSTDGMLYYAKGSRDGAQHATTPYHLSGQAGPEDNWGNNACFYVNNPTNHDIKLTISDMQLYRGW